MLGSTLYFYISPEQEISHRTEERSVLDQTVTNAILIASTSLEAVGYSHKLPADHEFLLEQTLPLQPLLVRFIPFTGGVILRHV